MPGMLPGCLLAALVSPQIVWGVLWFGLGMLTVALVTLMLTRWGHHQPLNKCIALSVWAHVLMAVYASSVNIVFRQPASIGPEIGIRVSDVAGLPAHAPDSAARRDAAAPRDAAATARANEPWSQFPREVRTTPPSPALARPTTEAVLGPPTSAVARTPLLLKPLDKPPISRLPEPAAASTAAKLPSSDLAKTRTPLPAEALLDPAETPKLAASPLPAAAAAEAKPAAIDPANLSPPSAASAEDVAASIPPPAESAALAAAAASLADAASGPAAPPPIIYSLRTAPDRAQVVEEQGGSAATEAAVKSALKWLAANQSPDGRWDASLLEAGREFKTLGQDRRGAGTEADMGMTGLALLAFLASGHTHHAGDFQPALQRGLQFLVRQQSIDGNLGGRAEPFAFMYCHAMAGLALSEACGMTSDRQWLEPVKRAVAYSLAAQNRTTGGWRYRPQEAGDTSQLGWQLMFLKSAEMAGVPMPAGCRAGIERYLQSVASGRHGGLAAYRPGHPPSRSMTAEALVCRLFLGRGQVLVPANVEAADYLLDELPGKSEVNFYYWYYATLGLYQVHDSRWRTWNKAVASEIVSRQSRTGDSAGSWDPDPVWGGYGGRVYSTALATLCLEVYYRFLPLYVEAAARGRNIR